MVSLDISKAYDMCWRYNILKKIKDGKIDGKLLHFINEFMKNRTIRVAIENTLSEEKQIENGVFQGTVLSVTLFLVAMAEIRNRRNHHDNRLRRRLDNIQHSQTRTSKFRQTTKSQGQKRHRLSNLN
jgi:hypothetical protein